MPHFFLVDPWLADAKGHNYQYALDVVGAAERCGYHPILGVRQKLSPEAKFPASWQVERLFPYGECPRHWLSLDGRNRYPYGLEGAWLSDPQIPWWRRVLDLPNRFDRRRRIVTFGDSIAKLFACVAPREKDLLYFPSMSEFDFLCAVRFWRDHSWTERFDWHLQFHFNFFRGRDPEYPDQGELLQRFQHLFREAVDQIPQHRLHFYATTEAIARQYDELGVAIFRPLPYPVRPLRDDSAEILPAITGRPLRVTLPGAMRREKGKKRLSHLMDLTWDEFLEPGRVQFVLQADPAHIEHWMPRRLRGKVRIPAAGINDPKSPILAAAHPLDEQKYAALIQQSDIGLFVYDGKRYFARASGVLCEMLSAGVPVIVPAGCWLADQIAEENFRYVDALWRQLSEQDLLEISSDGEQVIQLPAPAHALLVRFRWPTHTEPGTYAELVVESVEPNDSLPDGQHVVREILAQRESGHAGGVVCFENPVERVKIRLSNAYGETPLVVPGLQIRPLSQLSTPTHIPLGSIGLIAADEEQIPRLLRDMTVHHGHYLRMAQKYAAIWQSQHSPMHTVSQLESRTQTIGGRRNVNAA